MSRWRLGFSCSMGFLACVNVAMLLSAAHSEEPLVQAGKQVLLGDLYWRNGERLAGRLVGGDATHLIWDHEFTVGPSSLDRTRVRLAEFAELKPSAVSVAEWVLIMRNGDCILGAVPALNASSMSLRTVRHGLVKVALSEVQSLRRRIGAGMVSSASMGSSGWQGNVETTKDGALVCRAWNADLRPPTRFTLPTQFQLKLAVRTRGRPEFKLRLKTKGEGTMPSLETWNGELVLVAPNDPSLFTPLLTLPGEPKLNANGKTNYPRYEQSPQHHEDNAEQSLQLTLTVDRAAHIARVFAASGKELGSLSNWTESIATGKAFALQGITVAGMTGTASRKADDLEGLSYRNRNSYVRLEDLRVLPWNGKAPSASAELPRVELSDGTWSDNVADLAFDKVLSVTFAEAASVHPGNGALVIFFDGTLVSGIIASATPDAFELKVPWLDGLLHCSNDGLWRLCCEWPAKDAPKEPPLAELDTLKVTDISVHGHIECDGGSNPKWRMVGESTAQALHWPQASQLQWSQSQAPLLHAPPTGRLIMADGEVTAAKLLSIDVNGITISTPWSATITLPHEQVRALRLMTSGPRQVGFADLGWSTSMREEAVKMKVTGAPETHEVTVSQGGVLYHPGLITGADVTMLLKTDSGGLGIDLFASTARDPRAMKVIIWKSGNQVYAVDGSRADNGVRSDQMLRNVDQTTDVRVRLKTSGKEVVVRVNDVDLLRIPISDAFRLNAGIAFYTASLWGNQQRPVTIKCFNVDNAMPVLAPLGVTPTARTEALTVPRFRRDRLPKHVLVATNGDLIRGEVEAATDHAVRFAIGLESHDVPTERIDSIVWTQPPSEAKPEAKPPEATTEVKLPNRLGVIGRSIAPPPPVHETIPRKPIPRPGSVPDGSMRWLTLLDGSRLTFSEASFGAQTVITKSSALGAMQIATTELAGLHWAAPGPAPDLREFTEWRLVRAPEPVLPESGGASSPLLGKEAPTFVLPLLSGSKFDLKSTLGHVVVLDFWATWCGPCVSSLPRLIADVKPFGASVQLIGVNQGEAAKVVQKFIETRNWELTTVLDGDQTIATKYAVDGIPHTVIIDKKGKVSWVHIGADANGSEKFIEALKAALE